MKITTYFLLLFLPLFSLAQYESNPCDFRDSLDRMEMTAHDYNEPGWYDNLDRVYLLIDNERDIDHLPDSAVAIFPDIGLTVYEDHIQGNIFNGLTFFRKTDTNWTELLIAFDHNLKTEYNINRPDSINKPFLLEIVYVEGHAATRGSYEGEVHEIWDMDKYIRLAKFYTSFTEYFSSTSIDGSYTEGHSYNMIRSSTFDGKRLHLSNTNIEKTNSIRSNIEGEDNDEKVETTKDECMEVRYELIDGYFQKITNKK